MPDPFAFFIRVLNPSKEGFKDSEDLAKGVLEAVCGKYNMKLLSAADFEKTGRISDQVLLGIREADVVFADINTSNENVWYEIGYTHCINPYKLIFLFKEGKNLPFDIADYRGLAYTNDLTSFRNLENNLSAMVSKVLSHIHLERLLRLEYWDTAVLEYIGTLPELREEFISFLKVTTYNIDISLEMRKRTLWILLALDYINSELCERFSGQLVGEALKGTLFDALARLNFAAPEILWENVLSGSPRHPVLAVVAKAAVYQWLKGYIDHDYFVEKFVQHKEWIVGKHLSLNLLDNISDKSIPILITLAANRKPEVYKRFFDWIDSAKERISELDNEEVKFVKALIDLWSKSPIDTVKSKQAEISSLFHSVIQ